MVVVDLEMIQYDQVCVGGIKSFDASSETKVERTIDINKRAWDGNQE